MGVELIYTAGNRSLAMAEIAVHFTASTLPPDFVMVTIYIPDDLKIKSIARTQIPPHWNAFPFPKSTQIIGEKFVRDNKHCILKIPSVVTQGDYNYLLNPKHAEFSNIKIVGTEKFPLDSRIFK